MNNPLQGAIVEVTSEKRDTQVNMAGSMVNDTLMNRELEVRMHACQVMDMQEALSCEGHVVVVAEEEKSVPDGKNILDIVHSDTGHMT